MEPPRRRDLTVAAALALAVAALLRLDPAAAAAVTAVATLLAVSGVLFPAGLVALPVLLAALPDAVAARGGAAAAVEPRVLAGPVRIAGTVTAVRREPMGGDLAVRLGAGAAAVWLHCTGGAELLPGDRVAAVARCSAAAVPDGDGSLRADADAIGVEPGAASLPRACAALRARLEDRLLALVPDERGPLLAVLVLGNGTRLPGDVAAAHRATGLSHLLAVSGAHAAMLAWLLGLQPFGGGRRRPVGRVHLVVALLLLVVYGAITGLEPPVFRALCSYALVAAGLRRGRRVTPLQALAWPAIGSAVLAPEGVLGPSFCLSYAAVAGLCLAGPARGDGRAERWLWAPIRASGWATLTTAPWTLFWFGQLAPWTVLLTPLLAPLVGAMLFLGLGAGLLGVLAPGTDGAFAPVLDLLARVYLGGVRVADLLPGTPVQAPGTPPPAVLAAGIAGALLVWWWRRGRAGVAAACVVASLPHWLPLPPTAAALHLFAVGHGQACLWLRADGGTVLVDCGSQQFGSLPARKVEAALRRRCIDLLVLTHEDRDHCGSIAGLLRRVPIVRAVLPASMAATEVAAQLRASGAAVELLRPGARAATAGVVVMAPDPRPESDDDNDRSLWVRLDLDGSTVLAAADAEEAGVRAAIAQGIAAPSDVLLLPHHGRANAEGKALLATVGPVVCLCSCSSADGVPALALLARQLGVETFATGVVGDVVLRPGPTPRIELLRGLPLPRPPRPR